MTISFDLPEGVAADLADRYGDLSALAKESFIVHGYQRGWLSTSEVARLLALATRTEADQWLADRNAHAPLNHDELDRQQPALTNVLGRED